MSQAKYYRRRFDYKGNFIGAELFEPVLPVSVVQSKDTAAFFAHKRQNMETLPAYRKVAVENKYLIQNDLIQYGEFPEEAWANDTTLKYWFGTASVFRNLVRVTNAYYTEGQTQDTSQGTRYRRPSRSVETLALDEQDTYKLGLYGGPYNTQGEAKYISSFVQYIYKENRSNVEVAFDFSVMPLEGKSKRDVIFSFSVKCGEYYYDDSATQWQLGFVTNYDIVPWEDYGKTRSVGFVTTPIPADGYFELIIYELVWVDPISTPRGYARYERSSETIAQQQSSNPGRTPGAYLSIDNVHAYLLYNNNNPLGVLTRTYLNSEDYSLTPPVVEILNADPPELLNSPIVYPYAFRVGNNLTKLWKRLGYNETQKLIDLVLITRRDEARVPLRMVTGTIIVPKNVLFSVVNYLQIVYDQSRLFYTNSLTWDLRKNEFSGEWLEVLTDLPEILNYWLNEDGSIWLAEDTEGNTTPILLEIF